MSFQVTLQPSGHSFTTSPSASILTSGIQAGLHLSYSCRSGICGSCKSRIVSGEVDHGVASLAYLSAEERERGITMLCQAKACSDLVIEAKELDGLAGIEPRIVPCRVLALDRAAPDVIVLKVRIPLNEHLRFAAGQYVDMLLPGGERRSYSIACPPRAQGVTELEFHIRHLPGGLFTDRAFSSLKLRELLKFEGPHGSFFVREASHKPMVLIVSGTGFAPAKAMLLNAFAQGGVAQRPMTLYWGGRSRKDIYMMELAQEWAEKHEGFRFVPVLSDPTQGCQWQGRTGNVHEAVLADFDSLAEYQVYACGSPLMVNAARKHLVADRGLPESEFFADEFLNASDRACAPSSAAV